ncbi:MAG TPA: hypothetical protein VKE93_02780 [Candidatus Angelobacter sp.]|nr:hypothetical protein [Candidatus Angelobacter sp.]
MRLAMVMMVVALLGCSVLAQEESAASGSQTIPASQASPSPTPKPSDHTKVNWLYGAFVPKDVPLEPLSGHERIQVWVRATFTTYGIYAKTALFSLNDQANNHPSAWGDGWAGYGKRVASRQGQFVVQNSLSALGNGILGYEPRYDVCRCEGFWRRTGHAVGRNFVTYNRTENKLRPQLALYAGAFGAGVVAGSWTPNHDLLHLGAHGALSQAIFGVGANLVAEYWHDVRRALHLGKKPAKDGTQKP